MDTVLNGMHIAILVTSGFEQAEFTQPRTALDQQGAITKVVSDTTGQVQGFNHHAPADRFNVDLTFAEADHEDFDAVLLPGGVINADHIRLLPDAQRFIRGMQHNNKPVAVICHGAWLLISAGLVEGRTLTSWPSLQDDIRNAGGTWVDQEVVVDRNWISSRKPDDIPAFNQKMITQMASYRKQDLKGTAANENAASIAAG